MAAFDAVGGVVKRVIDLSDDTVVEHLFLSARALPLRCTGTFISGWSFLVELVIYSSFGGAAGMSRAGSVTPGGTMNLPLPIPYNVTIMHYIELWLLCHYCECYNIISTCRISSLVRNFSFCGI